MNRRSILKGLLTLPTLPALPHWMPVDTSAGNDFYILLHGLLFLEHCKDKDGNHFVQVKVPKVTNHALFCGLPNAGIVSCEAAPVKIDWGNSIKVSPPNIPDFSTTINCTLAQDIPRDIPSSMLQFSRKDTGLGDLVNSITHTIILPWPDHFDTIRPNNRPLFDTTIPAKLPVNVKMKDAIAACSDTTVGLVSVLHYTSGPVTPPFPPGGSPVSKFHYYFQPTDFGDLDINAHFQEAKQIFEHPENFDLSVDPSDVHRLSTVTKPSLPGLDESDEYAFNEPLQLNAIVSLYLELQKARRIASKTRKKGDQKEAGKSANDLQMQINTLVSSANCPNFFVGG